MQARMKNPVFLVPEAMGALQALGKATHEGLPASTIQLVHLRASQINGCGVCVDMHARELERLGESHVRLFAVAAWRDTPFFTDAELAFQKTLEGREVLPVAPPAPFNEDENEEATLIRTNLNTHVMTESLKFILGQRPFSDWSTFAGEVDGLGGGKYLDMVNTAKDRFKAAAGG